MAKSMKEKLSILTELIKLTRCDNKLDEQEYTFLLTVAQSLKVSKEDFDQLLENLIVIDGHRAVSQYVGTSVCRFVR